MTLPTPPGQADFEGIGGRPRFQAASHCALAKQPPQPNNRNP